MKPKIKMPILLTFSLLAATVLRLAISNLPNLKPSNLPVVEDENAQTDPGHGAQVMEKKKDEDGNILQGSGLDAIIGWRSPPTLPLSKKN